jgi:hypothetical protein
MGSQPMPPSLPNSRHETATTDTQVTGPGQGQDLQHGEQDAQQNSDEINYPTGFRFYLILVGLVLSFFLVCLLPHLDVTDIISC